MLFSCEVDFCVLALEVKLKARRPEHPDTGTIHNATGDVLVEQGKYEEAMVKCQMSPEIKLKAHGLGHPSAGLARNEPKARQA